MDQASEERVKVLAVDFDGVMQKWKGWKGKPTFTSFIDRCAMVKEFETIQSAGWKIVIWTARTDIQSIREWLLQFDIPFDEINYNPWAPDNLITSRKIPADVYLDDRAIQFNGEWEGMANKILNFKEWWGEEPFIGEDIPTPVKNPVGILNDAIKLFQKKNNEHNYNGNDRRFGEVMDKMYPDGLTIKGPEMWTRYGIFHQMVSKILRLSNVSFSSQNDKSMEKRMDNAIDEVVYSAMLAANFAKCEGNEND